MADMLLFLESLSFRPHRSYAAAASGGSYLSTRAWAVQTTVTPRSATRDSASRNFAKVSLTTA